MKLKGWACELEDRASWLAANPERAPIKVLVRCSPAIFSFFGLLKNAFEDKVAAVIIAVPMPILGS